MQPTPRLGKASASAWPPGPQAAWREGNDQDGGCFQKAAPQRAARLARRAASAALEDRGLRFLLLFSLQKGTKEA